MDEYIYNETVNSTLPETLEELFKQFPTEEELEALADKLVEERFNNG
jgi:hypothetical protein